jgi:hypothetical protein
MTAWKVSLRGIANVGKKGDAAMDHQESLSPRVRQIRPEDLIPAADDAGLEDMAASRKSMLHSRTLALKESMYSCWGSKACFPCVTIFVNVLFAAAVAWFLWEFRQPVIAEGSFGKLAQNIRPESVQEANFAKARLRAVSGPTLLGLDVGNAGANGTYSVGAAEGFEWRRVELIYQVQTGSTLDAEIMQEANTFENGLRDLPGWQELCRTRVPQEQRRYCDPGDSFPAVLFATEAEVTETQKSQGVLIENSFTGRGSSVFLPIPVIVDFLTQSYPEVFKRWYRIDVEREPVDSVRVLQTMFSFYLPTKYLPEWEIFASQELEQKLKAGTDKGIGSAMLFYRADGVESEEFMYSYENAFSWALVGAFGALVSTVIVTRRFLLGFAAFILASVASATSAAVVSEKASQDSLTPGRMEFPVSAIVTWYLNAVFSADLAISCAVNWHVEDPFPRTSFAEILRMISKRLNNVVDAKPAKVNKCKLLAYKLVRALAWCLDKSFPPRHPTLGEQTPLTDWYPIGRLYWFLVNSLSPSVVSGGVFLLISQQTELLLLQEFAMHAGPGLLCCAIFSVFIFPPVIDLGDVLHNATMLTQAVKCLQSCRSNLATSVLECRCMRCCIGCCRRCCGCFIKCFLAIFRFVRGCLMNIARKLRCHVIAPFLYRALLCIECGSSPGWRDQLRSLIETFALMLNGRPMRLVALIMTAAVGAGFFLLDLFTFVSAAPNLFPAGHRSREGPKVREIFGPLPRNLEAPEPTVSSARSCEPDAYDNATCSWYKCTLERRQQTQLQAGTCHCKYRRSTTSTTTTSTTTTTTEASSFQIYNPVRITATGSCSAVARIAGIDDYREFPQGDFWTWAENQLGITLGDGSNQVIEPQMSGSIEMENWTSGEFTVSKQFTSAVGIGQQGIPKLEDACVSMLCYCGVAPCELEDAWQDLGQVVWKTVTTNTTTAAPAGGRRLISEALTALERRLLPASGAPPFLSPRRLVDIGNFDQFEGTTKEGEAVTEENFVYVVYGLHKSEEIPFRTSSMDLKFDNFEIENPWNQRAIASLCEGVGPDLRVKATHCWVLDFRRWLSGQGETYPVRSETFYNRFFQFAVYRHLNEAIAQHEGGGASGGNGYDYFWLDESGRISGTFAAFKVNAPKANQGGAVQEYMSSWDQYIAQRNSMSVSAGWIASPLFAASQTAEIVRHDCYYSVFVLIISMCGVTLVLTCSLGITVATFIALCFSGCTFVTFWFGVGSRDIGTLEIVSLIVFLVGIGTPLVRVANAYSHAPDRPQLPAELLAIQEGDDFRAKHLKASEFAEELAKEYASKMAEGEISMFPGAINNERQNRVATAMLRGGASALGLAGAAAFAGLALLPLEMEALGQVGLAILCTGFAVTPAIGYLSLLLLLGLGDSKARRKAFRELGGYIWSRLSGKVKGEGAGLLDSRKAGDKAQRRNMQSVGSVVLPRQSGFALTPTDGTSHPVANLQQQPAVHKPHTEAAMMLGIPMSIATGDRSLMWKPCRKGKKEAANEENKDDDVGTEAGPCILTLDVQGATAKPPFHIVMATRDRINVKG